MKIDVTKSKLQGQISIPGSKSHTIRSFVFALLVKGESQIKRALLSEDTLACLKGCENLGAKVFREDNDSNIIINGSGSDIVPVVKMIDVGNSGTSLRLLTGVASLSSSLVSFDGDDSVRNRPMKPLLDSLYSLGASISSKNNLGRCPISIKGPVKGGQTQISGITSQFLSSLLIVTPLAKNDSVIVVKDLHEKSYVGITLSWLDRLGIEYENKNMEQFNIPGRQIYKPFQIQIPADFSTACFPLGAALVTGSKIELEGLDFGDSQGDKMIFELAGSMGASIKTSKYITSIDAENKRLEGVEVDLNDAPDALPVLAVIACFLKSKTVIKNVAQARIKECDRISAMVTELRKMGASIDELNDGMIVYPSRLKAASLKGYIDHRIVMALAIAGMGCDGETIIDSAESISVTYPDFIKDMQSLGCKISLR